VKLREGIPLALSLIVLTHVSSGDTERQTGAGLKRGLVHSKGLVYGQKSNRTTT